MRSLLPKIALLSALALPLAAHADSFTITGSGGGFNGSATLTATSNGNGSYTVTGVTSSFLTAVIAPGTFNGNDNLFFPTSSSLVDSKGLAFTATQGNTSFKIDLFSTGPGAYSGFFLDNDGFSSTVPVSLAVVNTSAVPEPSTWLLLGTGMLGGFMLMRKRVTPVRATLSNRS